MRPQSYYVIFELGEVTRICTGYREAREASPHRAYKSFKTRQQAEEFAAWWNYERLAPRDKLFSRSTAALFPIVFWTGLTDELVLFVDRFAHLIG